MAADRWKSHTSAIPVLFPYQYHEYCTVLVPYKTSAYQYEYEYAVSVLCSAGDVPYGLPTERRGLRDELTIIRIRFGLP